MTTTDRLHAVLAFAEENGDEAACQKFEIAQSTLDRYRREINERPETLKTEISDEQSQNNRTITTRSADITSLEELLEYSKVDLSMWQVKRHVVNSWEVTIKDVKTGKARTYTNYQVKAWLEAREQESIDDILKFFREDAEKHVPRYPKINRNKTEGGQLLEISVPDLHLGLLAWGEETGVENYDIKIAERVFIEAVEYLIEHTKQFDIKRILFPIGNDFFNVNSALNTTFAGTPQEEDCRWQKSFTYGRRMAVEAIDRLTHIADVDVIIVPGNHDYEKSFYLGESLYCWYRNNENVKVDNSPNIRKYYLFGNSLIGYSHGSSHTGKRQKQEDLPLIMADEQPEMWAKAKYREIHTGHWHSSREIEKRAVRVLTLPSLAPIEAWAHSEGYRSIREAQAHIWSKDNGKIASIHYHPKPEITE